MTEQMTEADDRFYLSELINIALRYTVDPWYPQTQPTIDQKYSEKKVSEIPNTKKKFQKFQIQAKLELVALWQQFA